MLGGAGLGGSRCRKARDGAFGRDLISEADTKMTAAEDVRWDAARKKGNWIRNGLSRGQENWPCQGHSAAKRLTTSM